MLTSYQFSKSQNTIARAAHHDHMTRTFLSILLHESKKLFSG